VGKQWETFYFSHCTWVVGSFCEEKFGGKVVGNFPVHNCGKFLWGKVWWESSGKFPTTQLNSGKFYFPPSLFPTVIFSGKTVGK